MQQLLTVADLARLLQRKPWSIYRAAERGEIPSVKIGRSVRFLQSDLELYLQSHRRGAEAKR